MTTTDWRGLCEELYRAFTAHARTDKQNDLLDRLQLALAQPEPEMVGPTDEQLLRIAAEAIEPYDKIGIDEYEAETECAVEAYGSELIAFARAVLARWGRPAPVAAGERQAAPVPVAVSERLPRPEDCDAEGRCWWFLPSRQFKFLDQCARWSLMAHSPSQDDRRRRTHWLPAHALPLPSGEAKA